MRVYKTRELRSKTWAVGMLATAALVGCGSDEDQNPAAAGGQTAGGQTAGGTDSSIGNSAGGSSNVTPAGSAPTFAANSEVTAPVVWGTEDAKVRINHVSNLNAGTTFALIASVDGIPCSKLGLADADSTILELACTIPPGNADKAPPKLLIQQLGYTQNLKTVYLEVPRGSFTLPVEECEASPTPAEGVALPQLCRADPGSIAATGRGFEGIYAGTVPHVSDTQSHNFGFVAGDGTYVSGNNTLWQVEGAGWLEAGRMVPNQEPWSPLQGFSFDIAEGISVKSGEFYPADATGTFIPYTGNSVLVNTYSVANALAVSMSSVAGVWKNKDSGLSLSIAVEGDEGQITGSVYLTPELQTCAISGTIRLREPDTAKNLYDIALEVTQVENSANIECDTADHAKLRGLAAIDFRNVGTRLSPVYAHTLDLAAYEVDKAIFSDTLAKE
ncbi:MAG TPA: hypothetical protein VFQ61_16360 [Polyangiaceae bacterium]|nr:hypothetical protein [Polyangiaceae bacterium]